MGHTREHVVDTAIEILDEYGLPSLSMRRLAARLGVQQSALYWHFESKQRLLAAMAEEVLRRGRVPAPGGDGWEAGLAARAEALRDGLLAYRDGAELVSTVYAFGLGAEEPHRLLASVVTSAGAPAVDAGVAATVVWQFVLGYTFSEQQRVQASSAGAIETAEPPDGPGSPVVDTDGFRAGIALILDGIRARLDQRVRN